MEVLMLTQVLPYPPDSGPKVKTYNVLKYLARDHRVTLVSFVRGDQSRDAAYLRQYCEGVYTVPMTRSAFQDARYLARSLATGEPFSIARDDRQAMRQLLASLACSQHFDVVHADQLNMAQYAREVAGACRILDTHNALWVLYKRMAETGSSLLRRPLLEREWRLLKRYEGRVCTEFDAVTAVTEEDRLALEQAMGRGSTIQVIPISVDTDEVRPVDRLPDANHILHIGTMFWPPNVDGIRWFLDSAYPILRAELPEVTFDVIGARPPADLVARSGSQGIEVRGYVPDPTPYLRQAAVMVVPLRAGGGMRVKILNALAQGLPIVSTSIGCEGIAVIAGRHLLVADSPDDFARATLLLLRDRALADELAYNGRRLVESRYDYRVTGRALQNVYGGIASTSGAIA